MKAATTSTIRPFKQNELMINSARSGTAIFERAKKL